MFGREKYNPQDAKELTDTIAKLKRQRDDLMNRIIHISQLDSYQERAGGLKERIDSIQPGLDKQVGLAQKEAEKLNFEYIGKISSVNKAMESLLRFEEEKLGMYQGPKEEPTESIEARKEEGKQKEKDDLFSLVRAYGIKMQELSSEDPNYAYYKRLHDEAHERLQVLEKKEHTS